MQLKKGPGYFFFHMTICMFALGDLPSKVQWRSPCGRYPGLAIWADEACQNIWNIWLLVLNSQLLSLFYHCLPVISLKASLPCNLKQQPHACDSKQTTTVASAELTISLWELYHRMCTAVFTEAHMKKIWATTERLLKEVAQCFEVFCHLQWCRTLVEACSKLKTNNTPCHTRLMCYKNHMTALSILFPPQDRLGMGIMFHFNCVL